MKQTINLKNRLGRKPTLEELIEFGEAAIEQINARTLSGETVNGSSFAPYSEDYAKQKGVSRNSVDLFLDGDMLGALDFDVDDERGVVEIKVVGDLEVKKGYNHHVGDTLPKRPWFGITTDEVNSLIANFADEAEESESTPERITLGDILQAVSSLEFD
jgi:hypothetical protein